MSIVPTHLMEVDKDQPTPAGADYFPEANEDPFIHTLARFLEREISRDHPPNQRLSNQAIDAFLNVMKRWATPKRLDPTSTEVSDEMVICPDDILRHSLSSWVKVSGKRIVLSQFLESKQFESFKVQSSHPPVHPLKLDKC